MKGADIYSIGDIERRKLIAVQMQSSSALRGSLKTNLVFGLFGNSEPYSDEALIDVLIKIGLWDLFSAKDGLETLIGEGGVNLSGGQRQRLNFAGLYLRAKYYKPSLILIDEPTSSLDDISEKAITQMISELAVSATTLVVAHRLKTLEEAIGILDISITQPHSSLNFYTPSELLQVSQYFRDLQSGLAKLEE